MRIVGFVLGAGNNLMRNMSRELEKTLKVITLIIAIVVLVLGFKAINSWVFVRQTETMFRYGNEDCGLYLPNYNIRCR